MPRLVVDSNYLRDEKLRTWLAETKENIAVLTDQAELEMAKIESPEGFLKSTALLADFPGQVVLAKEITVASSLRGKKKGMKKRLSDGKRTRAFRKWCRQRSAIEIGKSLVHHEAHENAKLHMEDVLKGGASFKDDLAKHAADRFTEAELAVIRGDNPWTDEIITKVLGGIMDFARGFFALHPAWENLPEARDLPHTFIFRYALCAYLHTLHWVHVGGGKGRKDEKFANDFVDVAFAAYATCFDGFLSDDRLAMSIYKNARYLLDRGFLREDLLPKPESKRKQGAAEPARV